MVFDIKSMKKVWLIHGSAIAFMFSMLPLVALSTPKLITIPIGWLLNASLSYDDNVYTRSYGNQSSMAFLLEDQSGEIIRLVPLGLIFLLDLLCYLILVMGIFVVQTVFYDAKFVQKVSKPYYKFLISIFVFMVLMKLDPTGIFRGVFTFTLF